MRKIVIWSGIRKYGSAWIVPTVSKCPDRLRDLHAWEMLKTQQDVAMNYLI